MQRANVPFDCHIFVCTTDRRGERKSCADNNADQLREVVKQAVAARNWPMRVRVSSAGCMGLCEKGPNIVVYPKGIWFSAVTVDDVPAVLDEIGKEIAALSRAGG
jgi:(2Fe-2S) ferredoxin